MSAIPILMSAVIFLAPPAFEPWQADIDKFAPAIEAFEKLDQSQKYPDDAILFTGSSSIRLWETIAEDVAPYPVIQRGYGGARYSDLAYYAERIVSPHQFRAVVIFVANDVSGSERDKPPAETAKFFQHVLQVIRRHNAEAPVFLVGITPTAKRWEVWEQTQATNAALRKLIEADPHGHYIDTAAHYLDDQGQPRIELFVADRLHQNRDGYRLWGRLIRAELDRVLGPPVGAAPAEPASVGAASGR
jgi:lysophospholipase L1-like esterase